MAEQTSVELGKSLLSQAQSRTRRLQKSADKKFYGALAIQGYDAYSKAKGVKAYEELYNSFEPLISQRANELEQSTAFKATHNAYLKPSGQNAPVFGANQWEEALLYNHVMTQVRAAKVGDSSLDIDVQKEMEKVRNKKEWQDYIKSYGNKLTAANSMKLTKTIDEKGEIIYSDPIITKLQKVAKQMSKSYGIMPDLLRVLGVGTSADLATQTFKDRKGVSYEILLPEADTLAKQKLQAALLAEMERGTFDEASEAEIAAGLTSVQSSLTPASKFEIDLAKLSKMSDIEDSVNDIQNGKTAYPAYIEEAVYTTADGTEHDYTTILESFDTELERDNFYRDWKRTAAQMYNVITDPEITALGGGITQDQFMQMSFEELLRRNKTTLEAGTLFGINTRYESMSPAEQYNLVASIVETYTANEEDNLSEEEQRAIEERTQQLEQATNAVSQKEPNNPVNLAKRIPEDFVFSSEEAKSNQIETDIKDFREQGYSDEDIDMYRSIMEEVGVDPTAEIQGTIQINNEERYNELAKELYGVENYEDLSPKQFENIKNPTVSINELANNITQEYYNKNLPSMYNYTWERFVTNPEDLSTVKEMRSYKDAAEKTPFNIAKEWWKEQGVSINNFKAISKYLYNDNISLLGTFRELNFDPVAFAFQQQGLKLPDMNLSLKEKVSNSLLDKA